MLLGVHLLVVTANAPAAGQQVDLNAIGRRYNQSYAAGDYAKALAEALRLEAGAKARLGETHPDYGAALYNLGLVYGALGRYAQAEEIDKRALAIEERALGPNHADLARPLDNLAIVHLHQGKYFDAEGLSQRALAIREKTLGPESLELARLSRVAATVGLSAPTAFSLIVNARLWSLSASAYLPCPS